MARLYSDENLAFPVVKELRRLGHDVLTIQESGLANQGYPDEGVLAFVTADNRAVVTTNRKHFISLHRASKKHAGIIVCTFDTDFIGQASRIDKALAAYDSLVGELIRVNRAARN